MKNLITNSSFERWAKQATLKELRRDGILVFFDLQEKVLAATLHNPINGGSIRWSRKTSPKLRDWVAHINSAPISALYHVTDDSRIIFAQSKSEFFIVSGVA